MLVCAGCLAPEPTAEELNVTGVTQPVIGGFDGTSPKLNAIGSISFLSTNATTAETSFQAQCTGALLSANTVLTAKHCLDSFGAAGRAQNSLVFGVGPDATMPTAYATVIAVERAPGNDGGYTGRGHDVGVLHLDKPLTSAQTVKIGAVANELVGQQFVAVGYGRADNGSELTKRRLGALTLKALTGRTYEFLFGTFEGFYHDYTGNTVPTACVPPPATTPEMPQMPQAPQDNDPCAGVKALRQMYESTLLEQTHELAVGTAPSDAQPCFGDSGGPLLKAGANGELFAYGVASGGVSSDDLICDHGAIYASIDPEMTAFLQQAISWTDPCDKLPARGACEGTRARRCSTAAEGTRRVVEVDCANAGLRCVLTGEGSTATCGS